MVSSSSGRFPGAGQCPISTATILRIDDQSAPTPKRDRSGMHVRHDDMRQSRRQLRPQVIEEGRHLPREDAAVLLRRDLAGNGRRRRRIRCGHCMPFLLAQTLLLLLFLLLEFFLPLLKLEIRFCQRITFLGLGTSPHTGAPASVRKWTARRGALWPDSHRCEAHCRVIAVAPASDFQLVEFACSSAPGGAVVSAST
jgi:hypothetical protein